MFLRLFILLVLLCSALGCSRFHIHPKATDIPRNSAKNQATYKGSFTQVRVSGLAEVNLHTHAKEASVTFHGDERDLEHVKWFIANQQLMVKVEQHYPKYGRIYLDISTRRLTSFSYRGSGLVVAEPLYAEALDLFIKNDEKTRLVGQFSVHRAAFGGLGSIKMKGVRGQNVELTLFDKARVQITGTLQLCRLNMKGQTWLSAYWLKSHFLKIRLKDNACVQLAGTTDYLDAVLKNNARLNGRYLRIKRAFVKTRDQAEADIVVTETQHTLATDSSNIYFYDLPEMRADFMAKDGAVLDLREWGRPYYKEMTDLNR